MLKNTIWGLVFLIRNALMWDNWLSRRKKFLAGEGCYYLYELRSSHFTDSFRLMPTRAENKHFFLKKL